MSNTVFHNTSQPPAHTPGPWIAISTGVWADNGIEGMQREIVWGGHNTRSAPLSERAANAKLVATAPELLAAAPDLFLAVQELEAVCHEVAATATGELKAKLQRARDTGWSAMNRATEG